MSLPRASLACARSGASALGQSQVRRSTKIESRFRQHAVESLLQWCVIPNCRRSLFPAAFSYLQSRMKRAVVHFIRSPASPVATKSQRSASFQQFETASKVLFSVTVSCRYARNVAPQTRYADTHQSIKGALTPSLPGAC